jgi:hypothetical protein
MTGEVLHWVSRAADCLLSPLFSSDQLHIVLKESKFIEQSSELIQQELMESDESGGHSHFTAQIAFLENFTFEEIEHWKQKLILKMLNPNLQLRESSQWKPKLGSI